MAPSSLDEPVWGPLGTDSYPLLFGILFESDNGGLDRCNRFHCRSLVIWGVILWVRAAGESTTLNARSRDTKDKMALALPRK
jgi:hypothetical protein